MLRLHMAVLMNSFQGRVHLVHNAIARHAGKMVLLSHYKHDPDPNNFGGVQTRYVQRYLIPRKMSHSMLFVPICWDQPVGNRFLLGDKQENLKF